MDDSMAGSDRISFVTAVIPTRALVVSLFMGAVLRVGSYLSLATAQASAMTHMHMGLSI
jgi:hypothetical protein